uniref:Ig-like domain-containing protein n=1 Tax=Propithecus coquereli TaxID=379532 RepID=A0A2K6FPQ6_PROCO
MTPTLTALLCLGEMGREEWRPGTLPKPTLWAEPDSLITWRSPGTIWCQGTLGAEKYRLDKEGRQEPWDTQKPLEPGDKAKFNIPSTTEHYAGRYHCYYYSPDGWSEPSDPLELVVTGFYHSKPTLSALPSPVVTSGGKDVTLLCQSSRRMDTFLLTKEGAADPPLRQRSKYKARRYQAEFSMSPVTSAHRGTYRCYSSLSTSPYLLSLPSDPLELVPSGVSQGPRLCTGPAGGARGGDGLMRGGSLREGGTERQGCGEGETQRSQRQRHEGPQRQVLGREVECNQGDPVTVSLQKSPHDKDPQGVTYAQVNHSRLRRGGASPPSPLSGEFLDMTDRQEEGDRQMEGQAAASEDPQEVTYAQLHSLTLRRETTAPPSSQEGDPPAEPSVYAALAIH